MLKITAIGNLTHDVELKMNEATGKPYAILRIASDVTPRAIRIRTAISSPIISPSRCAALCGERCAAFAWKGCKLAASGDFETITFVDEPQRQPGFLIKASDVEFLSPRKAEDAAQAVDAASACEDAA